MEIYDAHGHYLWRDSTEKCTPHFTTLKKKAPEAYKNFTDWPGLVNQYIKTVQKLINDPVVLQKIFRDNYLETHQKRG